MLAHVPSFERNPRGSPDFLAYPVPKACMHVLGTRVPRRLGVARSASNPKAAQALVCSLTPGLRISFGRVACMARAASVPGLWALGFLLLCGVCVWVRFAVGCGFCEPRQSWLGSWVGVFGHGLWCCPSFAGCLWCSWLGLGFGLLMGRVRFRARSACPSPFRVPVCGVGVRAGPGSRLCPALLGWVVGVCFLRFWFFFWLCGVGCWMSLSRALWSLSPHSLSFGLGCWPFLCFFWCVSACLGVPLLGGPLFLAWCCRFRLGAPPVPPLGVLSLVPSGWWVWPPLVVLAGGLVAAGCFRVPLPSPLCSFFFFGVGGACLFLPLPSLGWRTHWPAFSAVFRAAVGGCVLFGRVRAPWVGWAMYTLGSAPLLAGSGPGSAGWAAAPGGCVWLWVRGLGFFVSFSLCGAGFNLLGGPPPFLPGARWPRVWPAVPVCGVLVRRLPGCAVACFG